MTRQVSMLKPSVLMSLPVEGEEEEDEKEDQLEGEQTKATKLLCCQLTFGDDLVEDGSELRCRDVHVLKHTAGKQT